MLAQEGPLDHPIYFASRRLSAWELDFHQTLFIMIRPTPKTQDWAPELLITTYQKEECDEFIFSRFDYKPDSEDEKKALATSFVFPSFPLPSSVDGPLSLKASMRPM